MKNTVDNLSIEKNSSNACFLSEYLQFIVLDRVKSNKHGACRVYL
jgi:hypothetical protein